MEKLLLMLHIAAAVVLWIVSAHAFVLSRRPFIAEKSLRRAIIRVVGGLALVVVLGALLALQNGSVSIVTFCTRMGVYSSPAIIAFFSLVARLASSEQSSCDC